MKTRRVTVELSPMAATEFDRLQKITGLSTSELLRWSVTLMRIYVDSRGEGKDVRIVNPRDPQDQARIEFPLPMEGANFGQNASQKRLAESPR